MTYNVKKFTQRPHYVSNKVNPNLFSLIQGFRNHLALLDQNKSSLLLKKAIIFLRSLQHEKKTILFINNNSKLSFLTKKTALNLDQPYSNEYWIPGLLTNWNSFQPTIKSFQYCERYFGEFLKKKKVVLPKYLKQKKKLEGLTLLKSRPHVLVLFQLVGNEAILKEAQLLNIPVVAFTDCTKSFSNVDYPIPMDTESFSMVYLFSSFICKK
jgi:ribosomal protein S2